jgi:hypothetical protein
MAPAGRNRRMPKTRTFETIPMIHLKGDMVQCPVGTGH